MERHGQFPEFRQAGEETRERERVDPRYVFPEVYPRTQVQALERVTVARDGRDGRQRPVIRDAHMQTAEAAEGTEKAVECWHDELLVCRLGVGEDEALELGG